ncbi:MAG TPA: glycoside hydrolase family 27 protein [Opitutaceae bacterium]|jgi:hypothetical protein
MRKRVRSYSSALWLVAAVGSSALGAASSLASADFHTWAKTPPMGWNSWDCFATTLTEAQARAEADVMADKLRAHGWSYLVVDVQWYEPNAAGFDYRANAKLSMDANGRLIPAPNKFPSSADGSGFTALASYVHSKGLRFGIHLMRGIPRQAVEANLPILGTDFHAADIADKVNVCEWNKDMYGVDMSKPGAQAYYDSVFRLIASWGVDFVKVDDISRPYVRNEPEIEAVRTAIDRTGRAMVLSLSPGETDIAAARHAMQHANMWRISDDFWDHWSLLDAQFGRLDRWSAFRTPGAWPDADMIPIGTIDMGRKSWFSLPEERTLMTLWCIARSPLILGADLAKLDPATLDLITNDEVLAVDQFSTRNRQLFRRGDGEVAWVADASMGPDKFVALFNTRDPWVLRDSNQVYRADPVSAATPGQRAAFTFPVAGLDTVVLVADPGDSTRFWWPAVFREVTWVYPDGREVPAGRDYGSHGEKVNGLKVPQGAASLKGVLVLDGAAADVPGATLSMRAYGYDAGALFQKGQRVHLDLDQLGITGPIRIRDLWDHKDLGQQSGVFEPEIEWHGARLYRIMAPPPLDS